MGYLTESQTWAAGVPYFEADAVLTGGPDCPDNIPIQALTNRTAFLKKQIDDAVSGALTVMYANRLKTARNIAMTGDGSWNVTFDGSGNVTAVMTLAATGVAAGTYRSVTVDSKGRVTGGSNPTTLAGYGITDAQPLDSDLTALAALTATGFYVNTGIGTVAARTLTAGAGISISNGDAVAANPVITNTGVTSIAGTANQVNVSATTGGVTLSLPQAIHTAAKPSFAQVALAADPVNALDAATKQYVDNLAAGLEVKTSVRAATTANITLSGAQTIDGVAVVAGDRVLVKNQTTTSQNGIYIVAAGAWTRAADADAWAELISAFVFVESGTTNADTGWVCTVDQGGTLGTTAIAWTQFAGAGTVTAGAGITVSGNQVALAASGATAGTYSKVTVDALGRVTAGAALAATDIPVLDWSKINSGKPTTLAGYGISDAMPLTTKVLADAAALDAVRTSGFYIAFGTNSDGEILHIQHPQSTGYAAQVMFGQWGQVPTTAGEGLSYRALVNGTWTAWQKIWHAGNADARQLRTISATVAANALTLTLAPTSIDFRSNALASGTVNNRSFGSQISLVVPAGATLGTSNGQAARLAILAIDNGGGVELAVVNMAGSTTLDETTLISTTAISAAASSASVIYSAVARTGVPFRVVGFIDITEPVAGTWSAAPSVIQGAGGLALNALSSPGFGQVWKNMISSRTVGTTYYNTMGKPIDVSVTLVTSSTTSTPSIAATVNGVRVGAATCANNVNANACLTFTVPAGGSYYVEAFGADWALGSWAEFR